MCRKKTHFQSQGQAVASYTRACWNKPHTETEVVLAYKSSPSLSLFLECQDPETHFTVSLSPPAGYAPGVHGGSLLHASLLPSFFPSLTPALPYWGVFWDQLFNEIHAFESSCQGQLLRGSWPRGKSNSHLLIKK